MIELSNDIDEDTWIDNTIPLEFDCFSIDDDILEYLGVHSEFTKSNKKYKACYILNEYAYFGQEVNFHEVLQVQPFDVDEDTFPSMEELPSLL